MIVLVFMFEIGGYAVMSAEETELILIRLSIKIWMKLGRLLELNRARIMKYFLYFSISFI